MKIQICLCVCLLIVAIVCYIQNKKINEGFLSGTDVQLLTSKPYYTWYDYLTNWRRYPSYRYPYIYYRYPRYRRYYNYGWFPFRPILY